MKYDDIMAQIKRRKAEQWMDPERLYTPGEIAERIGLPQSAISGLRLKGCPFYGRKTTIRWVREFIAKQAGASAAPKESVEALELLERFVELVRYKITAHEEEHGPWRYR